jgi:hypothetical protein
MRHFYRTSTAPASVMSQADEFFSALGLRTVTSSARSRVYQGIVGTPDVPSTMRLTAKPEGGHYTFVEAETDQMGESRLDRNVKRFFVSLHNDADPRHSLEAAY